MDCYCDYDPPTVYSVRQHVARKEHRCSECGRVIRPGERYDCAFGIWGGRGDTFKTCQHCRALYDWVKAHVPCLCGLHGNQIEECIATAQHWAHQAPGLLFGAYRRQVLIHRARRQQ